MPELKRKLFVAKELQSTKFLKVIQIMLKVLSLRKSDPESKTSKILVNMFVAFILIMDMVVLGRKLYSSFAEPIIEIRYAIAVFLIIELAAASMFYKCCALFIHNNDIKKLESLFSRLEKEIFTTFLEYPTYKKEDIYFIAWLLLGYGVIFMQPYALYMNKLAESDVYFTSFNVLWISSLYIVGIDFTYNVILAYSMIDYNNEKLLLFKKKLTIHNQR